MRNKNNNFCSPNDPPSPPNTLWAKSWGFLDFEMATNENVLTQPKFELGITGIIQIVFQLF